MEEQERAAGQPARAAALLPRGGPARGQCDVSGECAGQGVRRVVRAAGAGPAASGGGGAGAAEGKRP